MSADPEIAAPWSQPLDAAQIGPQNGAISSASMVMMAEHVVFQRWTRLLFFIADSNATPRRNAGQSNSKKLARLEHEA